MLAKTVAPLGEGLSERLALTARAVFAADGGLPAHAVL